MSRRRKRKTRRDAPLVSRRPGDAVATANKTRLAKPLSPKTTRVWASPDPALVRYIGEQRERCLESYGVDPTYVDEHASIERAMAEGGYGRRQIYELVQNGADALYGERPGKIHVVLTPEALYCANEGKPIDLEGVKAIHHSYLSMKRGAEIGRFGLGFKSVLGVSDRPEFYSQSAAFGFDAGWAKGQIESVVGPVRRWPTLRLAQNLEPERAFASDPVLAELASWATTVVKLPRTRRKSDWLGEDLERFPAEFLLFAESVQTLVLEDRSTAGAAKRIIRLEQNEDAYELREGRQGSTWKVFRVSHAPSDEAREDAGELADRDELPVIWAAPVGGRAGRGRFWAFFPTEYVTTLSGILNAPWKTNEDRQNLLTGPFNEELINVAAQLVVENLPKLTDAADPGRVLDLMPARGREAPQWADELITNRFYELAAETAVLPRLDGTLLSPAEIDAPPPGLPAEALEVWSESPTAPANWVHPSADRTETRRSRVERLLEAVDRSACSVDEWLEALVEDADPVGSIHAVRAAAVVAASKHEDREDVSMAYIVLTEDDELVVPKPGEVFLPGTSSSDGVVEIIHRELSADPACVDALRSLGITEVDAAGELAARLTRSYYAWNNDDWEGFWQLVRGLDPDRAVEIIKASPRRHDAVRVKTVAGEFESIDVALLPGAVIPAEGDRDRELLIDTAYHAVELDVLVELGAVSGPMPGRGSRREEWWYDYRDQAVNRYYEHLPARSSRPQESYLSFKQHSFVGPLSPLARLTDDGRAVFTKLVLEADADPVVWQLHHKTRGDVYPPMDWEAPTIWMVKREGRLPTSIGPKALAGCVSPALADWKVVLPVASLSPEQARRLTLPESFDDLSTEVWQRALEEIPRLEDDVATTQLYAAASLRLEAPDLIFCRVGDSHQWEDPKVVSVVVRRPEFEALVTERVPVLLAADTEDATNLVREWGLRAAEAVVRTEVVHVPESGPTPLIDEFPALRFVLNEQQRSLQVVHCSLLQIETLTDSGKRAEETPFHLDSDTVYWDTTLGPQDFLERLAAELRLSLSADQQRAVLENRAGRERQQKLLKVRELPSPAKRLLAAVGASALRARLPSGLLEAIEAMEGSADDDRLSELALAVYGVDTLHEFRDELEAAGYVTPAQWAGSRSARAFVRSLGFPPEYAGFEGGRREPLVRVDGPPNLPSLHDFQADIVEKIRSLVRGQDGFRGLLSLPTGAGKTRVTVEALVDAIRENELNGPILWVAQTDELSEQAVGAWSEVWRSFGPGSRLNISRLWGSNEAEPIEGGTQLVVATISKLNFCREKREYDWLAKADCVVIDEAHGSTVQSYTRLLDWLGMARGRHTKPLLGLTATPFRGTSEEQTKRLVARYAKRRLDAGVLGDDQYAQLQERGVLARARHEILRGTELELLDSELAQLRELNRLPGSVEERVGADVERNRILLDSILKQPDDWTILVFAASVAHAQTMAALLRANDVPAAPISAATPSGARRFYIEEFRRGRIRVLTNYAVLTEGFDAPAVRAVYVARPTYAPNLYQQMIGRGLRGPLNGGKEECLVVDVEDNIQQYGGQLAFRHFEGLWSS